VESKQLPGEVQPKASRATIEVTTWVTKHAGGDGTGEHGPTQASAGVLAHDRHRHP